MTAAAPTVLFVGESPPPGAAPDFRPFDCASGTRLAKHVLGLVDRAALLDHVPRVNVFLTPTGPAGCPPWDAGRAATAVGHVAHDAVRNGYESLVLLGGKVAAAFGLDHLPAISHGCVTDSFAGLSALYLPHPSGASTSLNDPVVLRDARRAALPELVLGCFTLRPWHFRLDDPAVLADLAAAVSPHDPAVGAAALLYAASEHKSRTAAASVPLLARMRAAATPAEQGGLAAEAVGLARTPPWDCPLLDVLRTLLRPDGARALAAAWHPKGEKRWLQAAAKDCKPPLLDNTGARADRRAAVLRYALAGVA